MTHTAQLVKSKLSLMLIAAFALSALFVPFTAHAQGEEVGDGSGTTDGDIFGVGEFENELQLGDQDLRVTIARIINVALSLLGIVAVVIVLIGGFQWMTAGGNDEKVAGARKLIFSGVIGLAIILAAFAIARFALSSLAEATGTGAGQITSET